MYVFASRTSQPRRRSGGRADPSGQHGGRPDASALVTATSAERSRRGRGRSDVVHTDGGLSEQRRRWRCGRRGAIVSRMAQGVWVATGGLHAIRARLDRRLTANIMHAGDGRRRSTPSAQPGSRQRHDRDVYPSRRRISENGSAGTTRRRGLDDGLGGWFVEGYTAPRRRLHRAVRRGRQRR